MDNGMYIVTRYMSLVLMALRCNYTYAIFYPMFSCYAAFFKWSFWRPGALCVRFENCVLLGLFSPIYKRLKEQEGGLCTSSNESAFEKYCLVFFQMFFFGLSVFTSVLVFTIFFCRSATDTGSFTTMTGTDWAIDHIHFGSSSCKSKAIRR